MTVLDDSELVVVKEYIIFLKDELVEIFMDENEIRSICTRTNCQVELTNRILNRKIGIFKIVKYAIVQVKGKDDYSIRQCNRLLEIRCPHYRKRQEYNKKAYCCTLFSEESSPDNAALYFQYQRSSSTAYQFGNVLLKSPYESNWKRPIDDCFWKMNDKDLQKGIVMPSMLQTESYFSNYLKDRISKQESFKDKPYSSFFYTRPMEESDIDKMKSGKKRGKFFDYLLYKDLHLQKEMMERPDCEQMVNENLLGSKPFISFEEENQLNVSVNNFNMANDEEQSQIQQSDHNNGYKRQVYEYHTDEVIKQDVGDLSYKQNSTALLKQMSDVNDNQPDMTYEKTSSVKCDIGKSSELMIKGVEKISIKSCQSTVDSCTSLFIIDTHDIDNNTVTREPQTSLIEIMIVEEENILFKSGRDLKSDTLVNNLTSNSLNHYQENITTGFVDILCDNEINIKLIESAKSTDRTQTNERHLTNVKVEEKEEIDENDHIQPESLSVELHIPQTEVNETNNELFTVDHDSALSVEKINHSDLNLITLVVDKITYNDISPVNVDIKFGVEVRNPVDEISRLNVQEFSVNSKYDQINYTSINDKENTKTHVEIKVTSTFSSEIVSNLPLLHSDLFQNSKETSVDSFLSKNENELQLQNNTELKSFDCDVHINVKGNRNEIDNSSLQEPNEMNSLIIVKESSDEVCKSSTQEPNDEIIKLADKNKNSVVIRSTSITKEIFVTDDISRQLLNDAISDINRDMEKLSLPLVSPTSTGSKSTKVTSDISSSYHRIKKARILKENQLSLPLEDQKELSLEDRFLTSSPINVKPVNTNEIVENFNASTNEFQVTSPDVLMKDIDISSEFIEDKTVKIDLFENSSFLTKIPAKRNLSRSESENNELKINYKSNDIEISSYPIMENTAINFKKVNFENKEANINKTQILLKENDANINYDNTEVVYKKSKKVREMKKEELESFSDDSNRRISIQTGSIKIKPEFQEIRDFNFINDENEVNISTSFLKLNSSLNDHEKKSLHLEMVIKDHSQKYQMHLSISKAEAEIQSPILEIPYEKIMYEKKYVEKSTSISKPSWNLYELKNNEEEMSPEVPNRQQMLTFPVEEMSNDKLTKCSNPFQQIPRKVAKCFSFKKDKNKEQDESIISFNTEKGRNHITPNSLLTSSSEIRDREQCGGNKKNGKKKKTLKESGDMKKEMPFHLKETTNDKNLRQSKLTINSSQEDLYYEMPDPPPVRNISNSAEKSSTNDKKGWRKQNRHNPALETLTKLDNLSGMDLLVQQMADKLMIDISCLNNENMNYPEVTEISSESQSSETLFSLNFEIPIKAQELSANADNSNILNSNNLEWYEKSLSSDISSLTIMPQVKSELQRYINDNSRTTTPIDFLNSNFSNSTDCVPVFVSKYLDDRKFLSDFKSNDSPVVDNQNRLNNSESLKFAEIHVMNIFSQNVELSDLDNSISNTQYSVNKESDQTLSPDSSIIKMYNNVLLNRSIDKMELLNNLERKTENQLKNVNSNSTEEYYSQQFFVDRFYVPRCKCVKISVKDFSEDSFKNPQEKIINVLQKDIAVINSSNNTNINNSKLCLTPKIIYKYQPDDSPKKLRNSSENHEDLQILKNNLNILPLNSNSISKSQIQIFNISNSTVPDKHEETSGCDSINDMNLPMRPPQINVEFTDNKPKHLITKPIFERNRQYEKCCDKIRQWIIRNNTYSTY